MRKATLVLKGLRFGMLLQLAVGPVCLMVLRTSATHGFLATLPFVLAVTLADGLFIALSLLGATTVLNQPKARGKARILGGAVLMLFGLDMTLGAFNLRLFPGVTLFTVAEGTNLFMRGLLLTLSNPLTIVFWSGVLTAKVAENAWRGQELYLFSLGCVLATFLFLNAVSALGGSLVPLLPGAVQTVLNGAVGVAIFYFGLRLMLKQG